MSDIFFTTCNEILSSNNEKLVFVFHLEKRDFHKINLLHAIANINFHLESVFIAGISKL